MTASRDGLLEELVREMPWYISASMRFQMAVADQLDMPLADVHAIGALVEFEPIGAARLAELMGMTSGAVTRLVDRLERGGYVRRSPDPADRRRVVLRAVPERVAEIGRYYASMGESWQRQLADCSDEQLRFLVEFLRRGRDDTQRETARLRSDGRAHGTRRRREP
ncbi:MarR family winged helix-turn-helix transcriptional regulator [Stackebrandtia nassauensis]|uniref:Transcriptional regulator, MarR family n=1 Tax=Stackebrandtia nassauensis (strain DSM 44728 / CIP 108903 / NRRL B-16338 / NBRC 102104 / LLR-40K-21) TaxID=446470 RepID=D3QAM0_STANL|nr:MarR family transcriptional regulator [Stackebrandtia nassauensis]ADD42803.1 transcriptional regulator, MarR family [Stackebrandtia nassauensis DSM 44728]